MRSDPEVRQAASTFQLGLPRTPVTGRSGELLGRGTGSSLEFQEYRQYTPGDDIRHLDWAAYARSDSLMVRLYREEISPRTEILLDGSRSMLAGNIQKSRLAKQLAGLFALLAGNLGARPAVHLLDDRRPIQTLRPEELDSLVTWEPNGGSSFADIFAERQLALKPQAVRIVISDFLFPHDPEPLIRQLAAGASTLWIIQVLTAWEAQPTELGGRRLLDLESSRELNLSLNKTTIARYRERLTRLQAELSRNCRRVHAPFVSVIADRGLTAICRDDLCAAGILRAG